MSRPNVSICALSVIVLILIGLGAAQCGRGCHRTPPVVIVDSVFSDSLRSSRPDAVTKKKKARRRLRKSDSADVAPKPTPKARRHLDERVD